MAHDFKHFQRKYAEILARAWGDPAFKHRLLTETLTVLQESGVTLPTGLNVKVLEMEPNTVYLSVPVRPDLSAQTLAQSANRDAVVTPPDTAVILGSFSILDPGTEP